MDIIATTLIITIETQMIEIILMIIFWVEIMRMTKEKIIATVIPLRAEETSDFSVGIQAQAIPAVWNNVSNPLGAFYCIFIVHS